MKFLLSAVAALCIGGVAQAQDNPNQFDLHCTGTSSYTTAKGGFGGLRYGRESKPFDVVFSVDLDASRFVEKPVNGVTRFWPTPRTIYVQPTQIEVSRPDATPDHHWTILRSTGQIMAYDDGSSVEGQCQKAPFTGVPANKF